MKRTRYIYDDILLYFTTEKSLQRRTSLRENRGPEFCFALAFILTQSPCLGSKILQ